MQYFYLHCYLVLVSPVLDTDCFIDSDSDKVSLLVYGALPQCIVVHEGSGYSAGRPHNSFRYLAGRCS